MGRDAHTTACCYLCAHVEVTYYLVVPGDDKKLSLHGYKDTLIKSSTVISTTIMAAQFTPGATASELVVEVELTISAK